MTLAPAHPLPHDAGLAEPDLGHIPGPPRKPFVGHTLDVLRDSYGLQARCRAAYGPVFKTHVIGHWRVTLSGPDALDVVLTDRAGIFSAAEGWDAIRPVFPGGLLLRDGADHRAHRRILQAAFRAPAMARYAGLLGEAIAAQLADWPVQRRFRFYPAIKALTLRTGAAVFAGLPLDDPRADAINRALVAEVEAGLAPIRRPLPFTRMARGVAARRWMAATLGAMVRDRRGEGGDDFFSQMCQARDEDGSGWSDAEIVDHFNFLLMAAHDTTATTLTAVAWALGAHPDWQDRVAAEVAGLPERPDDAALAALPAMDRVIREALRLVPPVPFVPRRAMAGFDWEGVAIPAGTRITVAPGMVLRDPRIYAAPERFDPDRFAPDRAEDRAHRFAWAPFGGGAHKCIGMHFALLQARLFTAILLRRFRLSLAGGRPVQWQRLPIPRPRDGLGVILSPRTA